jgi:Periplasmic binding protein-like domain
VNFSVRSTRGNAQDRCSRNGETVESEVGVACLGSFGASDLDVGEAEIDEIGMEPARLERGSPRIIAQRFDNLDFAPHLDPPLSTVEVPSWDLGRIAGDYIVALCTGAAPPNVTNLPTRLLIRKTTGRPRSLVSLKRTG